MLIKEVKNLCFDLLKEKLNPLAYKADKKELQFTKSNEFGFDAIWFGTVEYKDLKRHKLYFYISVRVDEIEKLKNLYMNHNDSQKDKTVTCNINCGSFIGNPDLEFEISSPEDVKNAVATFWQIHNDHIVEDIKKYYDIDFLNSLYPKYGKKCNDWFNASSWYITVPTIAYLANKVTFPEFRKEYLDYLTNDLNIPESRFNKVNQYLDTISKK